MLLLLALVLLTALRQCLEQGGVAGKSVKEQCCVALGNETRSNALFILVAKSALHFPRGLRWVHLAGRAPSDNSP